MGTSSPTDAVVVPQSKGTGIASEDDIVSAASASLLASHEQGEYVKTGLTFANVDTTNEQVDVTSGVCYILDTSASTTSSRGAGGNAQIQSTSSSGYDTEIPDEQVYVVILPTDVVDLGLDADVENDIYISVDVTAQNSVTVHGTSGAAPSNPHLKIGTVNSSDGSTSRAADDPSPTYKGVTAEDLTTTFDPTFNDLDDETLTILLGAGTSQTEVEAIDMAGEFTNDVSTTAVPIYGLDKANLVYVAGTKEGDASTQFSDLISAHDFGGETVIGSATRGTPDGRTYSVDGNDLDLAMAGNTYNVLAFSYRLDVQG